METLCKPCSNFSQCTGTLKGTPFRIIKAPISIVMSHPQLESMPHLLGFSISAGHDLLEGKNLDPSETV